MPYHQIDAVAGYLTGALINSLWLGLALTALTWLVLRFGRLNAATRHAIWTTALAAVAILPLLNATWFSGPEAAGGSKALLALGAGWGVAVACIWALVAALMFLRLLWSYAYIRWLARTSTPLPELYSRLACQATGAPTPIRGSRQISVPLVIGLREPVVLMPEALLDRLSADEFKQIVLHEWAHIRRRDHWTNLAQELLKAICFFQPAVWWIGWQMRWEREIACDDAVVAATGRPLPYAGCLARLVEWTSGAPAVLSSGAVASSRGVVRRVERLVRGERSGAGFSRLAWLSAAGALLVVLAMSHNVPAVVAVAARPQNFQESMAAAEQQAARLRQFQEQDRLASQRLLAADETLRAAKARLAAADQVMRQAARRMQAADEQMRVANERMSLADILTAGNLLFRSLRVSCPAPPPPAPPGRLHKI